MKLPDARGLLNRALNWSHAHRARAITLVAVLAAAGFAAASAGYVLTGFTPAAQERVGTGDGGELDRLDADGDGLPDIEENYHYGTDLFTPDTDGDGLPDGWEATHSVEDAVTGARCPDPLAFDAEADCDDDGLPASAEHAAGTHPNRWDTDGDGMADAWEADGGLDPLDATDVAGDPDGDGLTNQQEHAAGSRPDKADADGDGLSDAAELDGNATLLGRRHTFTPTDPTRASTSGSGIPDGWLLHHGLGLQDPDAAHRDADGDALTNLEEYLTSRSSLGADAAITDVLRRGLDPTNPDTDDDGMPDGWEARYGLDPLDPADAAGDPDADGLPNSDEAQHGTDPFNADSDGDTLPDPVEIAGWTIAVNGKDVDVASDPARVDTDGDGLTDEEERNGRATVDGVPLVFNPANPSSKDTDADGLSDRAEVAYPIDPPHALDPTESDTDDDGLSDYAEDQGWAAWRAAQEAAVAADPAALDWIAAAYPERGSLAAATAVGLFAPGGDLDGDGLPNIVDPDSDGDGLDDGDEVTPPAEDGVALPATLPYNPDTDEDALLDGWEARYAKFNAACGCWSLDPTREDSDGNDIPDGEEDFDEDGLPDYVFANALEQTAGTDPTNGDSDDDCLMDGWEWYYSRVHVRVIPLDPLVADDPAPTARLPYVDYRTVPAASASSATQAAAAVALDADRGESATRVWAPSEHPGGDYWVVEVEGEFPLTMCLHQEHGTDPTHPDGDTDGDALPDAWEILRQTDPLADDAQADYDDDGVTNLDEHAADPTSVSVARRSTNPRLADTDVGGTDDGQEIEFVRASGGDGVTLSPLNPSDDAPEVDLDGDGVTTRAELCINAPATCKPTNPLMFDTDGDGLADGGNVELDVSGAQRALASELLDAGVVWLAVGETTFRFYGEAAFCDADGRCADATQWDSDGDGMPDGWEAHYGRVQGGPPDPVKPTADQASDEDAGSDLAEYRAGRPTDWDEAADGVWWLGTDPNAADTDGDGATDGAPGQHRDFPDLDYDYDNDGLHDFTGEDPQPFTDHDNDGAPVLGDMGRVWKWIGHPTLDALEARFGAVAGDARRETPHHDADGDGTPDHADRVPVAIEVASVTPGDTAWVGEALTVTGAVTVASGPDEGEGVPGATVLVNLGPQSAEAADVLCAGVTGDGGAFNLQCPLRADQRVDLPSDKNNLLGKAGGTVTWTYDAYEDPARDLGERAVTVWTYATLQGATPERALPGGDTATAAGRAVASGGTVNLGSRTAVEFPTPLTALNGDTLTATGRLVDGAGEPLANQEVELEWAGETVTATTDAQGSFSHAFDVATYDAPGPRALHARYPGAGWLRGSSNATDAMIQFPSTLTLDPPGDAVAGRVTTITGHLTGPSGEGVAGAKVTATLGAGAANGTTGADGAYTIHLTVPPATNPGTVPLTVSTEGNGEYAPSEASATVSVRRPVTFKLDPLAPATYYDAYTVSGSVVDNQGRPVRSLAGETVAIAVEWPPFYRGHSNVGDGGPVGTFRHEVPGPALSLSGDTPVTVRFLGTPFYAPHEEVVQVDIRVPTVISLPEKEVAAGRDVVIRGAARGANDEPLAGATVNVSIAGRHAGAATVRDDGAFALTYEVPQSQPLGPLAVTVDAPATPPFLAASETAVFNVVSGTSIELADRNVTGDRAYINGTLRDDSGRPLADLPVRLTWRGEAVAIATTNGEGAFSAAVAIPRDAEPGPVEVTAEFPGVPGRYIDARAKATYNILARGDLHVVKVGRIVIGEPFHLEGRLESDTGAPVTGPRVKIYLDDRLLGEEPVRFGRFTFDGYAGTTAPGAATLRVVFEGDAFLRPSSAEVPVVIKRRATLEVVHLPDTLRADGNERGVVRLVDDGGQPIQNVTLLVRMGDRGLPFTVRTGEDGAASFPLVAATNGSTLPVTVRYGGEGAYTEAQAQRLVPVDTGAAATQGLTILGATALALAAVGALLIYFGARRRRRAVGEARHILESLESQLLEGNEYVAAVLLAYRRLAENARRFGISEAESDTAREFGAALREQLPVNPRDVGDLLTVFEEARYSEHDIGPAHRDRATAVLRRIISQLDDHAPAEARLEGGGAGA